MEDVPLADGLVLVLRSEFACKRPSGDVFLSIRSVLVKGVEGEALVFSSTGPDQGIMLCHQGNGTAFYCFPDALTQITRFSASVSGVGKMTGNLPFL